MGHLEGLVLAEVWISTPQRHWTGANWEAFQLFRAHFLKSYLYLVEDTLFWAKTDAPVTGYLKSQEYINQIQALTINQKMELNEEKTKAMIFNFSRTKQFYTRLTLKKQNIETVKHIKLLGTIISDNLKWNKNT